MNTEFEGHYPVGTAAVVVADTAAQASEMLNSALVAQGLEPTATPEQFVKLPTNSPKVVILSDGDY